MFEYKHQDIELLNPNVKNPRMHSEKQIDQLSASILEFGFVNPVIVDETGDVIAGHGRLLAAQKIKMHIVPTIVVTGLTKDQKRALALADNKLGLNSKWNTVLLKDELNSLQILDFDLSILGFDDFVDGLGPIKKRLDEIKGSLLKLSDKDKRSKYGDIWQLGEHKIMCGDACDLNHINQLLDSVVPDLVFTDPPYGVSVVDTKRKIKGKKQREETKGTKEKKLKLGSTGKGTLYKEVIGDNSTNAAKAFIKHCQLIKIKHYIIWGGNYFTDFLPCSACWIVWDKNSNGNYAEVELAWTNYDKPAKLYRFVWDGMRRQGSKKNELKKRVHPTQKPVGLFTDIFYDFKGDIVFDGFLGSGSTLIACEINNRQCYGIEIDPYYVDVIIMRWQEFTGKKAVKLTHSV